MFFFMIITVNHRMNSATKNLNQSYPKICISITIGTVLNKKNSKLIKKSNPNFNFKRPVKKSITGFQDSMSASITRQKKEKWWIRDKGR